MANKKLGSAFPVVPFDAHGTYRTVELVDSFVCAIANTAATATTHSDLTWSLVDNSDSVSHVDIVASRDNHQGVVALATGATTPADGDVAGLVLPNAVDLDAQGHYFAALIEVVDVTNTKVSVGFTATSTEAVNSSAADVVAVVFDPEDANNLNDTEWFLQLNIGGVDLEAEFDKVPYVLGDWILIEIAVTADATNGTSVTAKVTTEDNSQVQVLSSTTELTTDLLAGFLVEAVGAGEELINIDTAVLRYWVRDDADMLGA